MRRILKVLLVLVGLPALVVVGVGAWKLHDAGGPEGLAQEVGQGAQRALARWGEENPELASSLRRHLAEAANQPDADLGDLHLGIDAWLRENAEELANWQGLTLAEDEDDLVRVLELRRGLTRKLTAGAIDLAPGSEPAEPEGTGSLEIHAGSEDESALGAAHIEPGLELVPGG